MFCLGQVDFPNHAIASIVDALLPFHYNTEFNHVHEIIKKKVTKPEIYRRALYQPSSQRIMHASFFLYLRYFLEKFYGEINVRVIQIFFLKLNAIFIRGQETC